MQPFRKGVSHLISRFSPIQARHYTSDFFRTRPNPASIHDQDMLDTRANISVIKNTIFDFTRERSLTGDKADFDPETISKPLHYLTIQANQSGIEKEHKDSVKQTTQDLRNLLNNQGEFIRNRDSLEDGLNKLERALTKHEPEMTTTHANTMNPR